VQQFKTLPSGFAVGTSNFKPHLQQAEASGAQEVQVLALSLNDGSVTQAVNTALSTPKPAALSPKP
jgi:hypothetical protein